MFRRASPWILLLAAGGCLKNHEIFRDIEQQEAPETPEAGAPELRAVGEACSRDEDCVFRSVCLNQTCTACPSTTRCRDDFSLASRNGCGWCAPDNQCFTDSDCEPGLECFTGVQCKPGCNDPSCCFGNLCSDPSCGPPPPNFDCSRVGCADGSNCVGTGIVDGCACNPDTRTWECEMRDGENECDHQPYGMPSGGGRM